MSVDSVTIKDAHYLDDMGLVAHFTSLIGSNTPLDANEQKTLANYKKLIVQAKTAEAVAKEALAPPPSSSPLPPLHSRAVSPAPQSSSNNILSRCISFLKIPEECNLAKDLRIVGGVLFLAGAILLAASLIFGFGAVGIAISALLLMVGTGAFAYSAYTYFTTVNPL